MAIPPQEPCVVFGQYLTVQPWMPDFNPLQLFPNVVMTWIRLPGLLGFLYKRKILEEIGGFIGRVEKLDYNRNSRSRGRFAQMAIYVNLDKPLIPQILVNRTVQRVEYEALPLICFGCGRNGHMKVLIIWITQGRRRWCRLVTSRGKKRRRLGHGWL